VARNSIVEIPLGSRVHLKVCPFGQPGIVTGHSRGKLIVEWLDLGLTTRHVAARLMQVNQGAIRGKQHA
jgi:hypothetical protein